MSDFKARIKPLSKERAVELAQEHGLPPQIAELNIFRVLLNHPVLAKEINSSLMMLLFQGNKLSHRARELIIMRLGWATGSVYEWSQHWPIAQKFGVDPESILAVRDWQSVDSGDVLSASDKAVLAAVDDTLEIGHVSADTWNLLVAEFETDEERLEVLASIANWRGISEIAQGLDIPLDDGMDAWAPDGKVPNQ